MNATTRFGHLPTLGILAATLFSGCATVNKTVEQPILPTAFQTRTGPYCVYTGTALAPDAPAIRHLSSLEKQLESILGIRVPANADPIEVYVLDGPESFRHFLTFYFPELPPRRAFFLAQGNRRIVYTYQGARLEEDLRHEATHALLHMAVADLPLWLDEGLAEYFEVEEGRNAEHLAKLPDDLANGWVPNLKRLEGFKDVRKMTPRDYRESWAWVHYCLNGSNESKKVLLAYLADLRAEKETISLSRRLNLSEEAAQLLAHIRHVQETPSAAKPVVRLQDSIPDSSFRKRKSFFARLADFFTGTDDISPRN